MESSFDQYWLRCKCSTLFGEGGKEVLWITFGITLMKFLGIHLHAYFVFAPVYAYNVYSFVYWSKYNPKPAADDLMKHHNLIKLFVEKDQTLMKSNVQVTSPYCPTSYSLSFFEGNTYRMGGPMYCLWKHGNLISSWNYTSSTRGVFGSWDIHGWDRDIPGWGMFGSMDKLGMDIPNMVYSS